MKHGRKWEASLRVWRNGMQGLSGFAEKRTPARLLRFWRTFSGIRASMLAASFAYYAFFSIFPLVALLLWVGSLFFNPAEVAKVMKEFFAVGGQEGQLVWEGVRALQSAHGSLNLVFGGVFLWASMRFFNVLVHGVNLAWHAEDLPWWQLTLKNAVMVLTVFSALLVGIIAPLLLQIARNTVSSLLELMQIHFPQIEWGSYLHLADLARFGLASVCLFYAFSVLYMLAPRRNVRFREVWFPALLVSILLQVGQVLFVNYLPLFLRYNAIYGAMGGVMFLLMAIYAAGLVVLAGACLCASREERPVTPSSSKY